MSKKYIGNLVQSLSGGSGGGGGGDTGVGKPYPGSTGGEYFNYYGDDSNKNEAPGDYSTTIGYNNKNKGKYSFMAGANNRAVGNINSGNYIIGDNNEQKTAGPSYIFGSNNKNVKSAIVIGYSNGVSAYDGIGSSYDNMVIGYNAKSACREGIVLGNNLAGHGYAIGTTILGTCNKKSGSDYGQTERITANSSTVIVGAGTSSNRLNAIEIDNTGLVAFPHSICLDSTTTSVNAITAPQDSSNVTTDDQTLATKSYVDANSGSGGVGEAYPGSTGGEIFNSYTGSTRNVASGDYSTAIGQNCKAVGNYSFAGGRNCTANGNNNICLGYNSYAYGTNAFFIGDDVKIGNGAGIPSNYAIGLGKSIVIGDQTIAIGYNIGSSYPSFVQGIYIGKNLKADTGSISLTSQLAMIGDNLLIHRGGATDHTNTNPNAFIIGRYNDPYTPDAVFVIGCGNSNTRKNGLVLTATKCKLVNDLQLNTDDTAVNAITPPQDPQNVTADDQTLVTKSYLTSQIPSLTPYSKSQVAYFEEWDNATILPIDGSSISLTTFGTIPTWSNRAIITFRWENELITKEVFFNKNEGIHLHVVQRAYSAFPETINYKHMRIEWNYTNSNFTAADFWTYDQDMNNAGAISNWSHTLSNATTCKILSVVFSE